jgi:hypothetical protein
VLKGAAVEQNPLTVVKDGVHVIIIRTRNYPGVMLLINNQSLSSLMPGFVEYETHQPATAQNID